MAHGTSVRTRPMWRVAAAAALLTSCACAHQAGALREGELDAVRAAIEGANAEYAKAVMRGDAQAMAALFTDDAELVPALQRGFVSGRTAIEAYQAKRLEGRRYLDVAITTVHLDAVGDLAWETGTNRVTIQQGESAPVTLTGRYLAVWRRGADGRWRIQADLPITDPAE